MSLLNENEGAMLLAVARQSIEHGLKTGQPLTIDVNNYPDTLQVWRATFVTLERNGRLRGCIGMLDAIRPLVTDVAQSAFSAAFDDPRFPPLRKEELADLDLHVSVLTPPVPMTFLDEADLIHQLRPGTDGLILQDHGRRATFLPSVWRQLPDAKQFLRHLKQKAGIAADYWSDTLTVQRYETQIFP